MILSNQTARRVVIASTGLHNTPVGPCNKPNLLKLINFLGYVQQDPLQVVARAHDHILWSRNNQYKPTLLNRLMEEDRTIFEHFCHDACVLPMDILPYWAEQFKRRPEKHTPKKVYSTEQGKQSQAAVLKRIKEQGPLCSKDFKSVATKKPKVVWEKPEHKQVLDYLWLKGDLAVSKRVKFAKYYDLAERIYPEKWVSKAVSNSERIDFLAENAMQRLGFGTPGEIMRFWEACSLAEIRHWCTNNSKLVSVFVESAKGEHTSAFALDTQAALLTEPPEPTKRLRIINPFDPLVRDRKRLLTLFNFDFRIEIYVPPDKRKFGYYVYPLLEFDSFIGRIEIRHDKSSNIIQVDNLWPEPGVTFGKGRMTRLESELERLRRFCTASAVEWSV